MESAVVQRNINVNDITVFERALVRNAVADDLINRCADGSGEIDIIQWGWVRLQSKLEE